MIIDSHCHLDFSSLYEQLDDVIKRAELNDVKYMLTICTTLKSFIKINEIVKKYSNIYGTFGIHPHETKDNISINSNYIIDEVKKNKKIIGVGETGLDFYYQHSDKKIQKKMFVEHINAASELDIPVIVHSRNAELDTIDILKNEKKNSNIKILIHCFSGSKDFAKKLLDLDSYISVSGIVTFSKTQELIEAVNYISIDKLLIETDSPYLAPIPYRGKTNEPSFLKHTLDKVSKIKNLSLNVVAEKTSNNFLNLFSIN